MSNPQSRFSGKPSCWKHCLLYFYVFVRQGEFDVKSPFDFQKCCNVKKEKHLGKLQRTKKLIHQTNIKHYWKSNEILSLESEKNNWAIWKIPVHVVTYSTDFSLIRRQMKNMPYGIHMRISIQKLIVMLNFCLLNFYICTGINLNKQDSCL